MLQFPYLIDVTWKKQKQKQKKKHFMRSKVKIFITFRMQHICQGLKDGSNSKSQYPKARRPARTGW